MTPTKLLAGQFFLVLAIVVAGAWFVPQWAASALACQDDLEKPGAQIAGAPFL